jgi:hypothetical protein
LWAEVADSSIPISNSRSGRGVSVSDSNRTMVQVSAYVF